MPNLVNKIAVPGHIAMCQSFGRGHQLIQLYNLVSLVLSHYQRVGI
jgi:hypothetical protein